MSTKIETGCLALVVGCFCKENNGKVVTVGKYIGSHPNSMLPQNWEVDVSIEMVNYITFQKMPSVFFIDESNLLRIDGYEPTKRDEVEKAKDTTTGTGVKQ